MKTCQTNEFIASNMTGILLLKERDVGVAQPTRFEVGDSWS
jgi:hypothetical protein